MPARQNNVYGRMLDWSRGVYSFLGRLNVVEIQSLAFSGSVEETLVKGAGNTILGVSQGDENYEGSITMHMEGVQKLIALVGSFRLWELPPFQLNATWEVDGRVMSVNLTCKFKSFDFSTQQGDTSLMVQLPLTVLDIEVPVNIP